jgi:hypothetical protein
MKDEIDSMTADELQCTQCGRIVQTECRTEMEFELETCSDKCATAAVFQMKQELREAIRERAQFLVRLKSIGRTCEAAAAAEDKGASAFRLGLLIRMIGVNASVAQTTPAVKVAA